MCWDVSSALPRCESPLGGDCWGDPVSVVAAEAGQGALVRNIPQLSFLFSVFQSVT